MTMAQTDNGHIIQAMRMFDSVFHLAWGAQPANYPDPWSLTSVVPIAQSLVVTETVQRGNTANTADQLSQTGVLYVVSVTFGAKTYVQGVDYKLTGRTIDWSILTGVEPAAGSGYQVTYRYNTTAIASLLSELGRRPPTSKSYVVPDPNGVISTDGATWSTTNTPTRYLYLQFKFDSTDAVGAIISQLGIFIGTVLAPSTPPATMYVTPAQVSDPGLLYMCENLSPFARYAGKKEIFEVVLVF